MEFLLLRFFRAYGIELKIMKRDAFDEPAFAKRRNKN